MAKKSQSADWETALAGIGAGDTVLEYAGNHDIFSKQTEGVMTPQKSQPKVDRANGKGKPPLATANGKTQSIDWAAFLAGISRGKTVLEYGANRTIFSQGDPADSVWYLQQGKVELAVTSHQGKEAIVTILGADVFFGEGCVPCQLVGIS